MSVQRSETSRYGSAPLWPGTRFLVWPAAILIGGTMLWAIGGVIVNSFQDVSFLGTHGAQFAGFKNYAALLSDPEFLAALGRSVAFAVGSVAGQLVLAVILALLTWSDRTGMKILTAVLSMPWAVSSIVVAILWRFIFAPGNTPLSDFLVSAGFPSGILASPQWALIAVLLVNLWQFTPLYFLFVGAGLRGIDPNVLQAAQLDGAGSTRVIWHIVLPQIRPLLVTLAGLNMLSSIGIFDLIWGMTREGPANATQTVSMIAYTTTFQNHDLGLGSASVMILTLIGALLTGVIYATQWGARRHS